MVHGILSASDVNGPYIKPRIGHVEPRKTSRLYEIASSVHKGASDIAFRTIKYTKVAASPDATATSNSRSIETFMWK